MVATFKVTLKRAKLLSSNVGIATREFNELVRIALRAVGRYWITQKLPLHFGDNAARLYQYAARTKRTTNIKRWAEQHGKIKRGGTWFPVSGKLRPLVWTGEMRDRLLERSPDQFGDPQRWATATANKQRVRIPIRLPHPMRGRNINEVSRINNRDQADMNRVGGQELQIAVNQSLASRGETVRLAG